MVRDCTLRPMPDTSERRHVMIPDELWDRIVAKAKAEDRNYSQIVRAAVRQYFAAPGANEKP